MTDEGAEHPLRTQAADVLTLFASSAAAKQAYQRWLRDTHKDGVRPIVLRHVSQYVYTVTVADVGKLRSRIRRDSDKRFPRVAAADLLDPDALHPLTKISRKDVQQPDVVNWNPPLAFNHAFHYLLEQREGRLFTFPEFRASCESDHQVLCPLLLESELKLLARLEHKLGPEALDRARQAIRWRVGCAYYAFLKELWILSWARRKNLDFRVHPLADTLFRTDFWTPDGSAITMYVRNVHYMDEGGAVGRKRAMDEFTGEVFARRYRLELEAPTIFGTVALPDARGLDNLFDESEGVAQPGPGQPIGETNRD